MPGAASSGDFLVLSPTEGGLVILAHSYRRHFGYLRSLEKGDTLSFTDVKGDKFNYQVDYTEVLGKTELDRLLSSPADLTLFTCTYDGERRVVVRCSQVK